MWLTGPGGQVSTLDLLGPRFTLMTAAPAWARASAQTGADLATVQIFPTGAYDSATWTEEYGVGEADAVLIRPDGHVAWRTTSPPHDAAQELSTALSAILARN
ncbi:hypothetical protein ACFSTC_12100 [Nonomuraea ferruginea]